MRRSLARLLRRLPRGRTVGPMSRRLAGVTLALLPGQITCREFEAFLQDYLDENVTVAQRATLERHLAICALCRVQLDTYLRTIELGRHVFEAQDPDEPLPSEVDEALVRAVIAARETR